MALVQARSIPIGGTVRLDDGTIYERKPHFTFEVEVEAEHGPEAPAPFELCYWKCMNSEGPHWVTTRADYSFITREGGIFFNQTAQETIGHEHDEDCPDNYPYWDFG